jgi:hypothetical protein
MTRSVACLLVLAAIVATPSFAAGNSGSISGYVKNSAGIPQMGASVQIFGSGNTPATTVFTDAAGFFAAATLASGTYQVRVSAPSFLPALRENVSIHSGANMVVNVTLNTLYEAIQFAPARRQVGTDEEDWKYTLRNMANRPVLRILDEGPTVVTQSEHDDNKVLRARVAFIAGSEAEGSSGAAGSTVFDVETSMFSSGKLNVNGNLNYNGESSPATVLRAAYSKELPNGSRPEIALTARRFALPFDGHANATLDAIAISASDEFNFFDFADVKLGTEYQTIQMLGREDAFKPFASLDLHFGPDTVISYDYATSQPNMRAAKGFDTAPADLSESGPHMSLQNFNMTLERARHHEVGVTRHLGKKTTLAAAFFDDSIDNPALIGVGDPDTSSGAFLPDLYSGTFTFTGRSFHTDGVRFAAQRKIADITTTLDYAYGGALEVVANTSADNAYQSMTKVNRHTVGCKVAGSVPVTHTRWIASYRWTSGPAVTPVDQFNASIGQADPYMNVFVRQPVPTLGFLPKMEALVDVRNLLAQGYTPIIGSDGHMLYLVQSARAVRGGVSFSF